MNKENNYRDEFNFKADTGFVKATQHTNSQDYWRAGFVVTPFGIVGYYAQAEYFSLDIVHNSRHSRRRYNIPAPTDRQVKFYANRYAKEIMEGKP